MSAEQSDSVGETPDAIPVDTSDRTAVEPGNGSPVTDDFPEYAIEPWRPLFDVGLDAQRTGDYETGRWACECILSLEDVPEEYRRSARINQLYFTPLLSALAPSLVVEPILFDTPPLWSRYNPTIAADGAGFRTIVQSSNVGGDPAHRVLTEDGIARTIEYLVHFDGTMTARRVERIESEAQASAAMTRGIQGCRLFHWNQGWYVTATTREADADSPARTIMLRLEAGAFQDLQLLSNPASSRDEKNWMPFIVDDELHFVYSCAPTVILRYRNGGIEEVSSQPGPVIARDFHGGSQGVEVDDGFLFVIHEAIPLDDGTTAYPHRFIVLDREYRISRVSTPFFFLHRSREFCCGMARRGEELVISFGFLDREAFVARVSLPEVLAALRLVYG